MTVLWDTKGVIFIETISRKYYAHLLPRLDDGIRRKSLFPNLKTRLGGQEFDSNKSHYKVGITGLEHGHEKCIGLCEGYVEK